MDADRIKKILIIMLIAIGVVGVILAIVAICTNVSCNDDKEEEHFLEVSVVAPTCTEKGYTLHACICGYGYKSDYVAALGHEFTSVAEKKATCEEDGYNAHQSCTRCNARVGYNKEEKLGHSWKDEEITLAATCTEDGKKRVKCERCGTENDEAIPSEGHKWGEPIIDAATCEADGEERKVCTACNEEEKKTLPALGHDLYNQTNGPTCTENIKHFELCHRCDYSRLLSEEADSKGSHLVKAEGIPCDDPKNGYACENPDKKHYRECSVCHNKIIENHIPKYIPYSDNHGIYCEVCGKTVFEEHTAAWEIKPSYHKKYCSKCNGTIQAQTPHTLVEDECSTCNFNSWTKGLSYTYNEETKTCTVSGLGSVTDTVIRIPKQIDKDGVKYTVTAIGANAFLSNNIITEVSVYSPIQSIGADAFKGCVSLKTVNIHNENLNRIYADAFSACNKIIKVVISDTLKWSQTKFASRDSVPTWSGSAVYNFGNANYISILDLSEDSQGNAAVIESVKKYAFYGWTGASKITLPATVKTIEEYAFANSSLSEVKISVETISAYAFNNCENINTLSLGGSIKTIASNAFNNCNHLKTVGIDNSSLVSIGESAFSGCNAVTNLTISDIGKWSQISFANGESNPANHGVSELYKSVSNSSNTIDHLDFSSSVSEIGKFAFYGWKGIKEVTIPSSVTKIGESAFENGLVEYAGKLCINGLESWSRIEFVNGYSNPGWRGWNVCLGGNLSSPLTEIDLSASSLTKINAYAFYGWKSITSIKLPTNLESVGAAAFSGCGVTDLELSIKNISASLFSGCDTLITLTLNGTVQSIGESAFSDCRQLEVVTIDNTALSVIGADAFKGCDNVKKLYLKDKDRWTHATNLGNGNSNPAHNGCKIYEMSKAKSSHEFEFAISTIDLSASTFTEIKPYVFYGWGSIDSFIMPTTLKTVGESAFYGCSGITELELSAETISKNAFGGCTKLERLTLNNATEIGERAFEGCGITELSLSAVTISEYAFSNCMSLHTLTLANTVKNIGEHAFSGCTITELVSSAETISANAFKSCTSLQTLTLNGNVQIIGDSAFSGCTSLATVSIDNSALLQIGANAFNGCSGISNFSLKDLTKWSQVSFGNAYSNPAYCGGQIYLIDEASPAALIEENTPAALTQIDLSQSKNITKINAYAFYGWKNITVVKIPDTLNSIGESAFSGCDGVTELHVDNIDQWLNNIELKNSGSSPLNNRAGSIYVGESLFDTLDLSSEPITSFTTQALRGVKGLTTITLPTSVETIGANVFEDCSDLTTITYIGNSLREIKSDAFLNCTKITNVHVSNVLAWCKINFANAGANPLAVTNEAASLKIYNGSVWVGNLGDVTLDASITKINPYTFKNTTINKLKVSTSLTSIGEYAFQGLNMKELNLDIFDLEIGAHAFDSSTLERLTLNGLKSIGEKAFASCVNLKQVTINSCGAFGASIFSGCGGLTTLTLPYVGDKLENVGASANTLFGYFFGTDSFSGATSEYQWYSSGKAVTYYIPDSLQNVTVLGGKIRYGAFYDCEHITTFTIGENVTRIENFSFAYCNRLTTINYNARKCADLIINNAFVTGVNWRLPKTTINIGANVEKIPNYLFYGAHCSDSPNYSRDSLIKDINFLTANGASACTKIGNYAFDNLYSITALHLPNSLKEIGEGAFQNCDKLTELNIVDSVETIGKDAFRYCSALAKLTIGKRVEKINEYAFNGCSALTEINFNAIKCSDFSKPKENSEDEFVDKNVFYDSLLDKSFTGVILNIGEDVTRVPTNILKKSKVRYILVESKAATLQIGEGTIGSGMHVDDHPFTIYFNGTELKEWTKKIKVTGSVGSWRPENVCYYSEHQPTGTTSGRGFWHYDDNHKPVFWS